MVVIFKHYRPHYGDWDFVKVDMSEGLLLAVGNSASNSQDLSCDLDVFVRSEEELKKIENRF